LRCIEDTLTEFGVGARQRNQQSDLRRPGCRGRSRWRGRPGRKRRRYAGVTLIGRLRAGDRCQYHYRAAARERGQSESGKE
jgi:hypothetical protein